MEQYTKNVYSIELMYFQFIRERGVHISQFRFLDGSGTRLKTIDGRMRDGNLFANSYFRNIFYWSFYRVAIDCIH